MGFFLTIVYLVIIYVRPQEFVEEMHGWPILTWLAAISVAVVFLQGGFTKEKFNRSPLNTLVLLFWLALCLSHVANFWFGGAIQTFDKFSKVVVVYFLIVLTCDSWAKLRVLFWTMSLMALFLAVQAIVQFYTGEGIVGGEALQRGEGVMQARGIGIFADPNDLALNMVPMVAFLLPAFHKGFMSRTWLTGVASLIPLVTGIGFTLSRGGILGLAAVGWFYLHKRVGKVVGIGGLLLLLSALMAIPRMDNLTTQEESARARLDHWSYGLGLLKSNPIFGVGVDQFTEDYTHTAHNSFILVVAEAGLLGGVLWMCLIYGAFWELAFLRDQDRGPPFLTKVVDSLIGALIGWLICAFFLSQTYKWLSFILMALVVATKNAMARDGVDVSHPWTGRQTITAVALTVGGIIFMHLAVMIMWQLP